MDHQVKWSTEVMRLGAILENQMPSDQLRVSSELPGYSEAVKTGL
jgi:hypothetical protein